MRPITPKQFCGNPRRRWSRTLGLSVLMAGLLMGVGCGKKSVDKAPPPTPTQPVTATTVTTRDVYLYYDTLGMATAFESVNIVSQVNGQVIASPFTQGSFVQKGDRLFEIFKPPYEAALLQAQGSLTQAEATLKINQLNLERNRPLLPQKLISEQDFQALQATVQENLGAIETARGQVIAAEVNLHYTDIRAPIEGMVGLYSVNVGNVVTSPNETVLTSIQRMDPIYIDFIVPIPKFAPIRKYFNEAQGSLNIRASYLGDPTQSREGPMTILGNQVANGTGTVNLRATMDNPDALFWPNQPVSIRIFLKKIKDAVWVPASAVSTDQNGQFVFLINEDNTVTQTSVTVGQKQDDNTIVIDKGLKAGDRVVTSGQLMLRTGTRVKVIQLNGEATPVSSGTTTPSTQTSAKTDTSSRS